MPLVTTAIAGIFIETLPTPSVQYRGQVWLLQVAGFSDELVTCLKGVDDTFTWQTVVAGL